MSSVTPIGQAKRRMYCLLELHLIKVKKDQYSYRGDWNDIKITDVVNTYNSDCIISLSTVKGARSRGWGTLYKEPVKTDADIIAELRAQIVCLAEQVNAAVPVSEEVTTDGLF